MAHGFMASPLGHSLVSCYFLRAHAAVSGRPEPRLRGALLLMVLASLPDLDVYAGPFDGLVGLFHRTITHSFPFALWIGCLIALAEALARGGPLLKRALLYAAVVGSHAVVDYFSVMPPYGGAMPLFWPFSEDFFAAPWTVLPSAFTYHSQIPMLLSYPKTFLAEAFLALPLLAYELSRSGWLGRRLSTLAAKAAVEKAPADA